MGNAAQVAAEMEMFALKKWAQTELYVRQFSNQAQENMISRSPGPDSGTLESAIKSDEKSLGVFNLEVATFIEDKANPDTGQSTAVYGPAWNSGHRNAFLRQSIPPLFFMEEGSDEAMMELMGKLSGIWGGI
jgi:hypothetical protein